MRKWSLCQKKIGNQRYAQPEKIAILRFDEVRQTNKLNYVTKIYSAWYK